MHKNITTANSHYPVLLKEIFDAPSKLFYEGDLSLLSTKIVSIIGTRKSSLYGDTVLDIMLRAIKDESITICSGLAYGIDQLASKKALDFGLKNIIVLSHGLDMTYPASGHHLRQKIISSGGLVLSEYPDGNKPQRWQFIKRNRIIAGLSSYLLIPEADLASGSLSTARLALENNRNVLAVPGPITAPSSRGTNWLLSQGATPINNAEDFRLELGLTNDNGNTASSAQPVLSGFEQDILDLLGGGIINSSDLSEHLNKPIHEILITITKLELNGIIKSDSMGQLYSVIKP